MVTSRAGQSNQNSLPRKLVREIESQFEYFELYLETLEKFLERESKVNDNEWQAVREEMDSQSGEEQDEYWYHMQDDQYWDQMLLLDYYFPDTLYKSFLVSLISYLVHFHKIDLNMRQRV